MYNELFNFNGSIDKKKPAAQLKQQAFHQIKNTKEFRLILPAGVLYQGRTSLQFFL